MQHAACPGATCSVQRRRDPQAVKTQQISLDSFSAMATLANWVETVRETWSKAETLLDEKPEEIDLQVMLANLSNLEIRQLKSGHHIFTGTRLTPATSAPGLGSLSATSAPGLGSPLPHLHRDWAHLLPVCTAAARSCASRPCNALTGEWEQASGNGVSGNGLRLL